MLRMCALKRVRTHYEIQEIDGNMHMERGHSGVPCQHPPSLGFQFRWRGHLNASCMGFIVALEILNPFDPVWILGIQFPCALFPCERNYSSLCLHVNWSCQRTPHPTFYHLSWYAYSTVFLKDKCDLDGGGIVHTLPYHFCDKIEKISKMNQSMKLVNLWVSSLNLRFCYPSKLII